MIVKDVKIHYGIEDETIVNDDVENESSSTSEFVGDLKELLNVSTRQKLAYLEKDYFRLDGNHLFPVTGNTYNVGWESEGIADASGNINQYCKFLFDAEHSSFGTVVYFDKKSIAKDFEVRYYNNDTLLAMDTITGNTNTKVTILHIVESWNAVQITIKKINPQQRARISSVSFGIGSDLDKNAIISASANKTTDISADTFEAGAFSFQFFNDGEVFNIDDIRDMPLALQEAIMATIYVKYNNAVDFVVFGKYNSNQVSIAENGKIITISGYDDLYNLNNTVFKKGIVYPNGRSLKAWAEEVAEDAGVDVIIDESFGNIISKGYITEVPHREAFRLIAEAGNGYLWIDNTSTVHIDKYEPAQETKVISRDDIVDGSLVVDSTERIFGCSVTRYVFSPSNQPKQLGYLEEVLLTSDAQTIEIVYSEYPVVISTVQVFVQPTSSAVVSNVQVYSDRIVFDLAGTDGDTSFVTITGTPYNQATVIDTAGSVLKNFKKIDGNYLITEGLGQAVAEHQTALNNNRYSYSAEIVTDTLVDLADDAELDGQDIVIEDVGFSVEYGVHQVRIEGVGND